MTQTISMAETPGTSGQVSTGSALFLQPLGGCNEDHIGSNATLVIAGSYRGQRLKGNAILIDFGVHQPQRSPDGWTQKFPDIRHLLAPNSPVKLRAIFLTHAHDDHIGAVIRYAQAGFTLPKLYGSELTLRLLRDDLQKNMIPRQQWPQMQIVAPGQTLTGIPGFPEGLQAVPMGHTLPGLGYLVRASGRGVFFSSDFKLDQTLLTRPTDLTALRELGEQKLVDVLCLDSSRAIHPGHTPPEAELRDTLLELARQHQGKRITLVHTGRNAEAVMRAAWLAGKTHRVLVHHGKSTEHLLRALRACNVGPEQVPGCEQVSITTARSRFAQNLSPSYVLNLLSGARGGQGTAFSRAVSGEDENLRFSSEDVVVISASILPWQAARLSELTDKLRQQGVEHIYVCHLSGHEQAGGLAELARMTAPQLAIVPLHGSHAQLQACRESFNQSGEFAPALELHNGTILQINAQGAALAGHEQRPLVEALIRPKAITPARKDRKLAAV